MTERDICEPLVNWKPPRWPDAPVLEGAFARLERLEAGQHAAALFKANAQDDAIWRFLAYGPFESPESYETWVRSTVGLTDTCFYAIRSKETGVLGGVASFLRINPEHGVIEVGHICLSSTLQKSRAATEAIFLTMKWAFDAGYRRFEWKCDAANMPSRRAAQRFGFSYEGTFRQSSVVKGRNRDTAWFAIIDKEWPSLERTFNSWFQIENFDDAGRQYNRLSDLTAGVRVADDPGLETSG
jgi:RimJ/RimL family protein N-acetyltransferase